MLIKYNEATECCVTNGAETRVVDWISYIHPQSKKKMLKTLFVELINPPTPIQLDGLPLNVVPISPDSKAIGCDLPDGVHDKNKQNSNSGHSKLCNDRLLFPRKNKAI